MGKGLWLHDLDNYIEVGWRGCRKAVDCVGIRPHYHGKNDLGLILNELS